jgi:hypothetical protein
MADLFYEALSDNLDKLGSNEKIKRNVDVPAINLLLI